MKSYTDLNQARKLTEILPLESADMCYIKGKAHLGFLYEEYKEFGDSILQEYEPCWSLSSLLDVLPKEVEIEGQRYSPCLFPVQDKWLLRLWYNSNYTITSPIAIFSGNPIDACYEMIVKLHESNLL